MGDTILSQTAVPWIRSRNIAFDVYRMKPRTRVYAFFDGVDITAYITPKVIELNKTGSNSNIINEVVTAPVLIHLTNLLTARLITVTKYPLW